MDYLELLDNEPIWVSGVGHMRCPTLREVKRSHGRYNVYLNLMALRREELLSLAQLDADEMEDLGIFELITMQQDTRALFGEAFDYFLCGEPRYDPLRNAWLVWEDDKPVGAIHRESFETVRSAILRLNHAGTGEDTAPKRFRNKRAREIYEKIQREKLRQQKRRDSCSIADVVSSLCTQSQGYNLTNVWNLTVYQLYDQFARQNIKNQIDIGSLKWAAWGTEPFDFSVWYQSIQDKQ